jgi:hypothetical protein
MIKNGYPGTKLKHMFPIACYLESTKNDLAFYQRKILKATT